MSAGVALVCTLAFIHPHSLERQVTFAVKLKNWYLVTFVGALGVTRLLLRAPHGTVQLEWLETVSEYELVQTTLRFISPESFMTKSVLL